MWTRCIVLVYFWYLRKLSCTNFFSFEYFQFYLAMFLTFSQGIRRSTFSATISSAPISVGLILPDFRIWDFWFLLSFLSHHSLSIECCFRAARACFYLFFQYFISLWKEVLCLTPHQTWSKLTSIFLIFLGKELDLKFKKVKSQLYLYKEINSF